MSYENFKIFCYAWMLAGFFALLILQFKNAPYGKFTDKSLGGTMSNRLGWVIMESFALAAFLYYTFSYGKKYIAIEWAFIALFIFHYANRSFIFPFRTKTKGKQIPVTIVVLGIFHNWVNGFLIGYYLSHFGSYKNDWVSSKPFIIGLIIFLWGMIINWHSDNILINLRKPGETGYKIPTGGLFRYVSSPNLLGEIIEWTGFAILTWSLPGLCFAVFTMCNLVPRAMANHRWYKEYFEDYPQNRKIILPFVL